MPRVPATSRGTLARHHRRRPRSSLAWERREPLSPRLPGLPQVRMFRRLRPTSRSPRLDRLGAAVGRRRRACRRPARARLVSSSWRRSSLHRCNSIDDVVAMSRTHVTAAHALAAAMRASGGAWSRSSGTSGESLAERPAGRWRPARWRQGHATLERWPLRVSRGDRYSYAHPLVRQAPTGAHVPLIARSGACPRSSRPRWRRRRASGPDLLPAQGCRRYPGPQDRRSGDLHSAHDARPGVASTASSGGGARGPVRHPR